MPACLDQDPDLTRDRDHFLHNKMGAYQDKMAGQEDRIWDVSTNIPGGRSWHLSVLFRITISPFQDHPIIPRTFI